MDPATLPVNIKTTVQDAFIQVAHAQNVNGRARTTYYKVATLLLASTVEAMLHVLIEDEIRRNPSIASKKQSKKMIPLQQLKKSELGSSKNLWICERVMEDFALGKRVMLSEMNDFSKIAGIIQTRLHKEIVYIRNKRNELHLQGLPSSNRSFTRKTVERTASALTKLVEIKLANP
jgi:hypothetical protein